jgi:hypothetical protein
MGIITPKNNIEIKQILLNCGRQVVRMPEQQLPRHGDGEYLVAVSRTGGLVGDIWEMNARRRGTGA